jgi:hypothetical protein
MDKYGTSILESHSNFVVVEPVIPKVRFGAFFIG